MTVPNKIAEKSLRMRIPCYRSSGSCQHSLFSSWPGLTVERVTIYLARRRRPSLASVDLTAYQRDGALIDLRGIPGLDGCEVGLSRLVSRACAPAVRPQEVRGRVQRIGRVVEIAGAIGQNVLRQKLRLADFAVHGAVRRRREGTAIDQLQRRIKLLGEVLRAAAIVGERRDRREHVLISALASKTRLHPPDGDERARRHAVALLNGSKQRSLRLLQCASTRDDRRGAALGEKLVERQAKTSLAAVGGDGRAGIVRRHQGRDGRGADAFRPRFACELALPGVEPGGRAAALRSVGL